MKFIISESQYFYLISEQPDSKMPGQIERFGYKQGDPSSIKSATKKQSEYFESVDPHVLFPILSVVTIFIPLVGPLLSAGFSLGDAAIYHKEGDNKTAGLVALFSLIPYAGNFLSKVPFLKNVGVETLTSIASKLGKNQKLTKFELDAVNAISENINLLSTDVSNVTQEMAKKIIENSKNVTSTSKSFLTKIAKGGLKLTGSIAGYTGLGAAYSKTYDTIQKDTPKLKSEKEGYNWDFVKSSFGSSGTSDENQLLNQAWSKGWRPGKIVPKEYQTKLYQDNYNKEVEDINNLNKLISQSTKT